MVGSASEAPSARERVAHADVGRQVDVGVAEGTQRDVVGRPRADPGQRQQRPAYVVAVGAAVERDVAGGQGRGEADQGPAASSRHRQLLGVERGERRGVGEQVGQAGDVGGERSPVRRDEPSRRRCGRRPRSPADRARRAPRSRRRRRGRALAGRGGVVRAGRSRGSPVKWSATAIGSQSPSSSRRTRATAALVSRRSCSTNRAGTRAVCPGSSTSPSSIRTVPGPCGRSSVRAYHPSPVTSTPSTARTAR